MTDMDWLMYANIAVWIGLGAYLAFLRNQIALNRRLTQLETLRND
ncbi:MAG: CcmD family protein [Bilophila wadsworthia]